MTPVSNWLKALENAGKNPKTIASYQRGLQHFITWNSRSYRSDFTPSSIIPRDVSDWRAYQQRIEAARPTTINQRLVALGSFFRWAIAQGLITRNPMQGIKTISLEPLKPKALDKRAERLLLRAVHQAGNLRDIAMVEVLLGTGIRVSELLDLKSGDVEVGERSGKLIVRSGKQSNYREIPLTTNVRKALTAYLDRHPVADAFWVGQRGDLQDRSGVNHLLEKYALLAGIEPIGPHALRHTFSMRYLERNPGDLRGLAALLGHHTLHTVMIYTQPTFEDLAERMEKPL